MESTNSQESSVSEHIITILHSLNRHLNFHLTQYQIWGIFVGFFLVKTFSIWVIL